MSNFEFDLTAKYSAKNALQLAQLSQLIYSAEADISRQVAAWGFDRCSLINTPKPLEAYDTQALLIGNAELIIVVFRGSESRTDWKNNLDFVLIEGYGGRRHELEGKAHRGFSQALDSVWLQVRATLQQFQNQGQTIWFTGHSLGAALATLAVSRLVLAEDKPVGGLYTFGSPRVGDRIFAEHFNSVFKSQAFRIVNGIDVVPRLPPRQAGYSHVGLFLYFSDSTRITDDQYWWIKLLDSLPMTNATIDQRLETSLVGAEDHAIDLYIAHLERDIHINPFRFG